MNEIITTDKQLIELEDELTEKQKLFSKLYASDEEFFGNGVQSYIEVYDPDKTKPNWYLTACSTASQILSNIKVSRYIEKLLELKGLNDGYVDKQLEFLITQQADFRAKISAIHEYNQLKRRISAATINPTQINVFISEAIAKKNDITPFANNNSK